MVIEENEKANYLAHFKTKGAKNGIRRFQSYMVAPNPSGATGVEIGEAAEQRARIHGDSDDNQQQTYKSAKELRKEARRQKRLQKIAAKRKKKEIDDKSKWSKSYRELAKHKDAFTNEELRRAIERLELEDRITGSSLNSVRDKTQKGADILKNLDSAGRSMAGIYNTVAGGLNVYHEITGKGQKLPKFRGGNESINLNKSIKNQDKNKSKANNYNKQENNGRNTTDGGSSSSESSSSNSGHNIDLKANARVFADDHNRSIYETNEWNKNRQKRNKKEGLPMDRSWRPTMITPVPYDWNQTGNDEVTNLIKKLKNKKIRYDAFSGPYLEHYGKPGQKWYHRFFQSYKTAPTRSGKVGEEHGLASAQAERVGEEETSDNSWETKAKILSKNGFKKSRDYYGKIQDNSYDKTTNTETGQKLTGDVWSHGEQYESNRKTEDVEEFCKFYDDLAKNWKEKQEKILDAYIDVSFNKNGSANLNLPWMFHDDGDGSYTKLLVTKNHDTGSWEEHRTKVSKEQAINDTKEYLRKMDVSIRPSSPGCVEVSYEGATSDDTMNLWGDHSIDLEELDMKTLKSRVKYLSING